MHTEERKINNELVMHQYIRYQILIRTIRQWFSIYRIRSLESTEGEALQIVLQIVFII